MVDHFVFRDTSNDYTPPLWAKWSDCVRRLGVEPESLGLTCQQAALNRFSARYRVARAFEGVTIRGLSDTTVRGYSGLFRLFLSWSAFEQYLKALPCKQPACGPLISRTLTDTVISEIRALDTANRFFNLIINKATDQALVTELEKYKAKQPFNPSYLASGIRHIFAHGILTPNSNKAAPEAVTTICNVLASAHLAAAGNDFQRRVRRYLKENPAMNSRTDR